LFSIHSVVIFSLMVGRMKCLNRQKFSEMSLNHLLVQYLLMEGLRASFKYINTFFHLSFYLQQSIVKNCTKNPRMTLTVLLTSIRSDLIGGMLKLRLILLRTSSMSFYNHQTRLMLTPLPTLNRPMIPSK